MDSTGNDACNAWLIVIMSHVYSPLTAAELSYVSDNVDFPRLHIKSLPTGCILLWRQLQERHRILSVSHPEELFGGAGVQRPVGDLRLLGQVLGALDRRHHPLHGQEGGQVGGVGWDDDEGEEPPDSSHDAAGQRAGKHTRKDNDGKSRCSCTTPGQSRKSIE